MNKVLRIYTTTKLSEDVITDNMDPIEVLRLAEKEGNLYRFRKDIHFCSYKLGKDDKSYVTMIFTIKLPNTTGSSVSSEIVMDVVEMLETILSPIDYYQFFRNVDGINKNVAILQIKKLIEFQEF